MRKRVSTPGTYAYEKGIRICERWEQFEAFLADMGEPPKGGTLDRIDPMGTYEPGNCRWLTIAEQQRNRTNNVRYEWKGQARCIPEWAEVTGIAAGTLEARIARGWTIERALSTPADKSAGRFGSGCRARATKPFSGPSGDCPV